MANEMKVQLRQISATTSEAAMGPHRVLVDRSIRAAPTSDPWAASFFWRQWEAAS
jgi:hypothetical protein